MTENHGFFSQDADRVAALIDAVNSPNFGALVDLGNFSCADEETTLSVSRLAPYAFFVHCKDFLYKKGSEIHPGDGWITTRGGNYVRGTIVGHGAAGIPQSIGTLKRLGYDGWLSLEFEGTEDNLLGIQMGLANMKRFWEMA
jgi:sugar phosphate isomerase/epimerase